ncbi:hypothetical protein, partial [Bradyrhizobium brasilense]|uniref:hypothetical protein n=1 Tax=Bradyrhizobium brasilense TaxID=1419277 RepID=UPI001E3F2815
MRRVRDVIRMKAAGLSSTSSAGLSDYGFIRTLFYHQPIDFFRAQSERVRRALAKKPISSEHEAGRSEPSGH